MSERSCVGCSACCFTHPIESECSDPVTVVSAPFEGCAQQCAQGCAIYGTHPQGCKEYFCLWREGWFVGASRPDVTGVVIDNLHTTEGVPAFWVRESIPGAISSRQGRLLLFQLLAELQIRRQYQFYIKLVTEVGSELISWREIHGPTSMLYREFRFCDLQSKDRFWSDE